ncbi:MAG: hypothetical protein JWR21_3029 [Herminiimonas sp.]|nr:hypothetical protein [Herminiimonas sp.]MDB5855765.1 hypothetical protein [Herminiimonas sp.]
MAIYDLYGFMSDDMEVAKSLLEASLDIEFEVRDSDYQGGKYYKCGRTGVENFVLKRNVDPFDGEPAEMPFPDHKISFYVNDTLRSADLQNRISQKAKGFVLLRHEDFE